MVVVAKAALLYAFKNNTAMFAIDTLYGVTLDGILTSEIVWFIQLSTTYWHHDRFL